MSVVLPELVSVFRLAGWEFSVVLAFLAGSELRQVR